MTFLPQVDLGESFGPFEAFRQDFGFLPNLFPAQSLLPRIIEAEAQIAGAVLLKPGALTQIQKESLLFHLREIPQHVLHDGPCVPAELARLARESNRLARGRLSPR